MSVRATFYLFLIFIISLMGCGSPGASNGDGEGTGIPPGENQTENSTFSAGGDDALGQVATTETDLQANDSLVSWIEEKNTEGMVIPGFPDASYTGLLVDWDYNNNVFSLAIDESAINPFHQRALMEAIVKKWLSLYPDDQQPAGLLKLVLYDGEINPDKELGYSEIDSSRRVNTVHYATTDIR